MKRSLKFFISFIVIAFLMHGGLSYAQGTWTVVTQPDIPSSIYDVFFLPDGQTGWFIGTDGMILRTTDGGVTREAQVSGTTKTLNRIVFVNDSTGWIVGDEGTILKTKDSGMTWNAQNPVDPSHDYNDIAVVTETNAFIVADKGKIIATTDGETWIEQTSGTTNNLYGISSFGFNVAIAVGKNETILRTTDGGNTWIPAASVTPIQGQDYNAVKMVSEKKAWLVGNGSSTSGLKSVFALTEDGGENWTLYLPAEEVYSNIWDLDFTDDTTGIAVGDHGVVFTTINGIDWIQQPGSYGFNGKTVSLVGNNAWTCQYQSIVKTEDFAQTWDLLVNVTGHDLYNMYAVDESHTIAIGYGSSKLETTDGGYTWQSGYIIADNRTTLQLWGINFVNSATGWVVGQNGFIAKTEDGGDTWHLQADGMTSAWLREVFFVNDTAGWIVGANGTVFKTVDGGNNWTEQIGLPDKTLYSIFMFDENNGVIGGADNTLYYTTDSGTSWNLAAFTMGTGDDINGVFFFDASHGWAVGEKGNVLFTADGGATWSNQTSDVTTELEDVYFRNAIDGWIVGADGLILATIDGGTTWVKQGEGVYNDFINGIAPKHGSIIWAAACSGTILKYVDDSYLARSNVKMNEIFYNSYSSSEQECQFIELYNAGSEIEYLDGMIICNLDGDINKVTYIWQFPGTGADYPIFAGEYKIVAVDAITFPNLDLSNADFEFFVEGEQTPNDNPDAVNLSNLKNDQEFSISLISDEVILGSGKDVFWEDGIDIETIIDGVEYDKSETSSMSMNDLVDAGHAIGPGSNYQGKPVERKKPGMDTNNSTNDFRLIKAPTPWGISVSYKISGAVNYYSNNKPVAEVTMNLTGITDVNTQTGSDGKYMFDDLIDSDFILTGEKMDDIGEAVDPYDASLILQYAVNKGTLTPAQKITGDVTLNGEVTVYDASYILRKYVGVLTQFPAGKDWTFVPTNFILDDTNWSTAPNFLEYRPLDNDYIDQNFIAFAYGDVSGNWSETGLAKAAGNANINFGTGTKLNDKTIILPINMEQTNLILSGGIKINFDNTQYRVVAIRQGELLEGTMFASAVNGNTIAFVFANAYPIRGAGIVATIDLEVLKDNSSQANSFNFSHISLNEGSIKVHVNGRPFIEDANIPDKFALKQNYPNPFNPVTSIAFDLPKDTKVTIKVYDILGQEVGTIVNKSMTAGSHSIQYNASNLASGVYFYKIKTKEFTSVKKMILLK